MASNRRAKWYPLPFTSYSKLTDALFWEPQASSPASVATKNRLGNVCRRGRLRSQKSASVSSTGVTKVHRIISHAAYVTVSENAGFDTNAAST